VIDLVGDDQRAAVTAQGADRGHAIGGENRAGRIGGRVDHDGSGPRGDPFPDRLGPVLKAVLFGDAHVDRPPLGVLDEVRIARVVRIAQHDLVAGIQQMSEQQQHRGRGAGRDEDLVGRDRHAVGARVVLRDRLPQRQDAQAVRVARPAVLDRARQGVADGRWRLEIGLAELEVDDVDAGALELLGSLRDLDGEERLDLLDALREGHERRLPTRRRARATCQSMAGPWRSTPTLLPA